MNAIEGQQIPDGALHVYAHVPFCVDPCGYCDFYRGPHKVERETLYVDALVREIDMRIPAAARIETLYFGGGTPSLLSAESWERIFGRLHSRAVFADDAEISIESNPASVTPDAARLWRSFGVNRVSVGVQSLNDAILKYLNRLHTAARALDAVHILRESGMPAVNADLIYGIPNQTADDVVDPIDRLAPWIHHLSAYALTIAAGTPFYRRGVVLPENDVIADQYERILERAAASGLARYEISNFARPGFECRHNLNTWRYGECVAIGPSASGFDGARRYKNAPDLDRYAGLVRDSAEPAEDEEHVGAATALRDRLMLGLRMSEGVKLDSAESGMIAAAIESAGLSGEIEWTATGVRLKPGRMVLMDEFLARLGSASPCL